MRSRVLKSCAFAMMLVSAACVAAMFALVLAPQLLLDRTPIFRHWPRMTTVEGIVLARSPNGGRVLDSVAGATVSAGGFAVLTDAAGRFRLRYATEDRSDVPIVAVRDGHIAVAWHRKSEEATFLRLVLPDE